MNILTKHYGFNENNEPKYLIYLRDENNVNLMVDDVIGDVDRIKTETFLTEKHDVSKARFIDYNTYRLENGILTESYPLILVFYMDKELLANEQIFNEINRSIDHSIKSKEANIIAYMLPCDSGEDRIECINPVTVGEEKMNEINDLVNKIKGEFDIND